MDPFRFALSRNVRRLVRGAVLTLALGTLPLAPAAGRSSDPASGSPSHGVAPEARLIIDAMYAWMGTPEEFNTLPALGFTFTYVSLDTVRSSRTHWWDRRDGRYRIEGKNRSGQTFVVLFNVQTRAGEAWLDGKPLAGEEKEALLKRAYGLFINDTYWLLMPFKLDDDGVHVVIDGEAVLYGNVCDRLKITFDKVGLTPGDTYWAYVDRITHRMVRWGFILEDEAGSAATESLWDWNGWRSVPPLSIPAVRVKVDDPDRTIIQFEQLYAVDAWPDPIFTNPAPRQR